MIVVTETAGGAPRPERDAIHLRFAAVAAEDPPPEPLPDVQKVRPRPTPSHRVAAKPPGCDPEELGVATDAVFDAADERHREGHDEESP